MNSKLFDKFIKENQGKTMNFLRKFYDSVSETDLEDIYQDSCIALYKNISKGKLDNNSSSLFNYFLGICKNQASNFVRDRKEVSSIDDNTSEIDEDEELHFDRDRVDEILGLFDEDEEDKNSIFENVRRLVHKLPHPCNELLWDYYESNLSMKEIALMYDYNNEDVAKQIKSRCMKRFKDNYKNFIL